MLVITATDGNFDQDESTAVTRICHELSLGPAEFLAAKTLWDRHSASLLISVVRLDLQLKPQRIGQCPEDSLFTSCSMSQRR